MCIWLVQEGCFASDMLNYLSPQRLVWLESSEKFLNWQTFLDSFPWLLNLKSNSWVWKKLKLFGNEYPSEVAELEPRFLWNIVFHVNITQG